MPRSPVRPPARSPRPPSDAGPREVVLVYPFARRYTGAFSTHRFPGLATAHAGLPLLGEILRRRGHRVRIYDEQITPFSPWMFDGADLVGISTQTSWAPRAYEIAQVARSAGKPVVLGGAHPTLNPDEALDHADFVVRNEGERTLPELLEALEGARPLAGISGLSFHEGSKKVHNPARPFLTNDELDRLPDPNWGLIEGWTNPLLKPLNRWIYYTQATRGCPFHCTYCSITREFGRALRHRSARAVLAELHRNFDPDRQFLFFMDDSLAANRAFFRELLEGMIEEKLVPRLGWHSQMRSDVVRDPKLLDLMVRTRCMFATFGFESINPKTLDRLKKSQSVEQIERCIAAFRERGILVNGFFMLGGDDDTVESIRATEAFASRAGCMLAGFMPMTPFPGTAFYEELDAEGRIFTKDWELYDVQHVVFHPRRLPAETLYRETLACYDRFYGRLSQLKNITHIRWEMATPFTVLLGASWPLTKRFQYRKELLANRDYLRMLRGLGEGSRRGKASVPPLDPSGWAQEALTMRPLKRAWGTAARALAALA